MSGGLTRAAMAAIAAPDAEVQRVALERQAMLTKPAGALGRLEALGVQLAGLAGVSPPPVPHPATVVVFAADHGVVAQGVTPWPQAVTAQMVVNICEGGAAINAIAAQVGADVIVVDVGVVTDLPGHPLLQSHRVRSGTADLTQGPAMSQDEAWAAMDVGVSVATDAVRSGARCLVTGEMGIGSTTASAAVIAALTQLPASAVTGRGTGIGDDMLRRKVAVVAEAAERVRGRSPEAVLAEVGGLEIAALAGFVLGGAAARVPVVLDGVITLAGTLVAAALAPAVVAWLVAGHRSVEPGATAALEHLGLEPLLDLGLRLGEGTGGALALPLLGAAARVMREMATFGEAGVG